LLAAPRSNRNAQQPPDPNRWKLTSRGGAMEQMLNNATVKPGELS
jgi:hypothetical protein